jgi:hypothetical protein
LISARQNRQWSAGTADRPMQLFRPLRVNVRLAGQRQRRQCRRCHQRRRCLDEARYLFHRRPDGVGQGIKRIGFRFHLRGQRLRFRPAIRIARWRVPRRRLDTLPLPVRLRSLWRALQLPRRTSCARSFMSVMSGSRSVPKSGIAVLPAADFCRLDCMGIGFAGRLHQIGQNHQRRRRVAFAHRLRHRWQVARR